MSARNMRSTATSTSVTRSIVPFLSTCIWRPKCAICRSPARTTASTAVVRKSGSTGMDRTALRPSRYGVVRSVGGLDALHHPYLHSTLRCALQLHVVHEIADEKDAAAARLEKVFRGERVGDGLGVESLPLIADADGQLRHAGVRGFELDEHVLARVV